MRALVRATGVQAERIDHDMIFFGSEQERQAFLFHPAVRAKATLQGE